MLVLELEHLKIETRLIREVFANAMGERFAKIGNKHERMIRPDIFLEKCISSRSWSLLQIIFQEGFQNIQKHFYGQYCVCTDTYA